MKNLKLALFFVIIPVLFQSCKDEDGINQADIIGVWTTSNVDIDITVNDVEFSQYLTEVANYSAAEAAFFNTLITTSYEDIFENFTIEFKADNTYEITIPGEDNETGPWSLNSNSTILTVDEGTADETEITINTLTSNTLILLIDEEEATDIDEDGTDETLRISSTLTLIK